jgi:hypothetical protein
MLALFFGLTNSSSLAESLMSVFTGTIMLSDFGCCIYSIYIYIYAHANYSGGLVQLEMGCDD